MRALGVLVLVAGAGCVAPKGRPLAVPAAQAFETFEPLIDCAGLAGLMASELPGAVEIRLDDATTLRYHIAGEGYYLHVVVDEQQVPIGQAPEREAQGMQRGEELFACAEQRRSERGPAEALPPQPAADAPSEGEE